MSRKSFNPLPENFEPGDHDVVIGKGKKYFFHKGNTMLRGLASLMLIDYANAKTKLDKSLIIKDVVDHVRQNGHFVKRSGERWVVANELLCREKISAVFRDALQQRCIPSGGAFTKRTEAKFRAKAPPQAHAPFQWKIQNPPPTFGLTAAYSEMPHVPKPALLTASEAASDGDSDIFSIFFSALANINEEGDPFEPKPIQENSLSNLSMSSLEGWDDPHCLSPWSRAA